MKIDVLVAEIGSTTTIVNAFNLGGNGPNNGPSSGPEFLGQGTAPTTVAEGDVSQGLTAAKQNLWHSLCGGEQCSPAAKTLEWDNFLATSSAAGGLRMSVHGLVYDMTVKAGTEAALGAGANICLATSGKLTEADMEQIQKEAPNLILLSGGTDYGDKETALHNARLLADPNRGLDAPIIYCGNIQNHNAIKQIIPKNKLYITENVYPRLDELNIEPVRKLIHQAFEEHITKAPGMENIRELIDGAIIPTPGAVMQAAMMLYEQIGDLTVIDVGGATTDIHSVAEGCEDTAKIQLSPEPTAKRTVEGDLGLYINAANLIKAIGLNEEKTVTLEAIPKTEEQLALAAKLAFHAAKIALIRHTGTLRHTYGPSGRQTHAVGKDLTNVKYLIATGGALTRLPSAPQILQDLTAINQTNTMLFPQPGTLKVLTDKKYIMAGLGALSRQYPTQAKQLLKKYIC